MKFARIVGGLKGRWAMRWSADRVWWRGIVSAMAVAAGASADAGPVYTRVMSFQIPDEMTALPAKESLILSTVQGHIVNTRVRATFETIGGYDAGNVEVYLVQASRGTALLGVALGWSGQGTFSASFDTADLNGEVDFLGNPLATWIMIRESGLPGGLAVVGLFSDSAFDSEYIPDCPADLDNDGTVGLGDIASIVGAWGVNTPRALQDLDVDGQVGLGDLAVVIGAWGLVCPCPNCQ